jgi:tetratricopeptide (TPR) repeat protein
LPRSVSISRGEGKGGEASRLSSLLVFAAALAVKSAILYALHDHPMLQPRGEMDSAVYVALAQHSDPRPYFVSPLYIYFLRLCGVSLATARVVQILLGSVAVVLVFDTARLWFGRRAAAVAATLAILTGVVSFYEITILPAALDPFLVASMLWLLARALKTGNVPSFGAAGFALGLLVLNRPNALLWAPFAVVGIFLAGERRARAPAVFAAAFLLAIAPVTIRNYAVARAFVPISSHGGLNFYIGNNAEADGTYHHVSGVRPTIIGQVEDAEGKPFYGMAWRWIRSRPADAFCLFLRKIAYTFNEADLALNYSYAYFSKDVASPLPFLVVGPWLLFPLGLAGIWSAAQMPQRARFFAWASFVPVYALSVALFFVSSRYRLPLLFPMFVTAGAMFVRARPRHWLGAAAIAIGVLWNFNLDEGRAHQRTNMVVYLIEQNRLQEAARLADETLQITRDPATLRARSAEAFHAVGVSSVRSGDFDRALTAFTLASRYDPADARNPLNIAVLRAQRGEIAAARANAETALRLRPDYPQAEGLLRMLDSNRDP